MSPSEPPSSNNFRYFVLGVLCAAVLLGAYFVQLNAQVDRARDAANERLALCRQVASVARSVLPNRVDAGDACEQLNERISKSLTPR